MYQRGQTRHCAESIKSRAVPVQMLCLPILALILCAALGCQSLPSLDPTGESLCKWPEAGADRLSSSRELELERNVSGNSTCGDTIPCWQNVSQSAPMPIHGEESNRWTAQHPDGAVLFPKKYEGTGPLVVLEPRSIIAQVGTEVIMVASYIGPENEYLRVGEKLEWNLDGVGRFLTGNPRNGCLYCDITSSKKIDDRSMLTVTSSRLWRIHRGTASQTDDVSILRGQSWTTVQSFQEGTSSISVLASDIDNWNHRTAGGQIHWIDASFYYPKSGIAPIGEAQTLQTAVYRRSTDEPRPGWLVRYEVVSGPPVGFGPNFDQTVEVMTDDQGVAKTILNQREGSDGCSKLKVQIIRPASGSQERVVVDERIISQTWTGKAPLTLQFAGAERVAIGSRAAYSMHVTNLTDQTVDAVVRVNIPSGMTFAAAQPAAAYQDGQTLTWLLDGIPPHGTIPIQFDMNVIAAGVYDFNARVERRTSSTLVNPAQPVEPVQPITPNSGDLFAPTPGSDLGGDSGGGSTPSSTYNNSPARLTMVVPLPEQARVGEKFSAVIKAMKTGQVDSAIISMVFPDGVSYIVDETGARHTASEDRPLEFASIAFDTDYPINFVSQNVGVQSIAIRLLDGRTRSVLAEQHLTINVVP